MCTAVPCVNGVTVFLCNGCGPRRQVQCGVEPALKMVGHLVVPLHAVRDLR